MIEEQKARSWKPKILDRKEETERPLEKVKRFAALD